MELLLMVLGMLGVGVRAVMACLALLPPRSQNSATPASLERGGATD